MAKAKVKADHRADLRDKPFVGLPAAVLYSAAYTDLSLWARAVLIEVLGRFNGFNNGAIGVSQRELTERLGTTNFRQIAKATAELMAHGLLDVAVEGKWKQRHARLYRLTFISSGKAAPFRAATNDYRDWTPTKALSGADDASAGNTRFADRASAGKLGLAEHASAATHVKLPFRGTSSADDASALIGKPYQGTETRQARTEGIEPQNTIGVFSDHDNVTPFPSAGTCEQCSAPFRPAGRGKPKRFCSEPCRKSAETARRYRRIKGAA